jgi:hypothetical protein
MADKFTVKDATAAVVTFLTDEIIHPVFGTGHAQVFKLLDGTPDGVNGAVVSSVGGLSIGGSQTVPSTTSWTSATALNTANTVTVSNFNTVTIAIVATTTLTGGAVTFEVSVDNTNWFPLACARIDSFTVESVYTLAASTNRAWATSVDGFLYFRVRLSTAITGTATVGVAIVAQAFAVEPIVSVGQATAANLNASVVLGAETTKVIGTVNMAASQSIAVTQATAASLNATVTPIAITKGTQGATGFTVQDLKDAGRSPVTITGYQVAGTITTETLTSLIKQTGGTAAGAATSFTVTAGKTFRIQAIKAEYKQNAGVVSSTKIAVRYVNSGGTIANTSPIIALFDLQSTSATSGTMVYGNVVEIPDGMELGAGAIIGIYNLSSATTNLITFTLIGYEY